MEFHQALAFKCTSYFELPDIDDALTLFHHFIKTVVDQYKSCAGHLIGNDDLNALILELVPIAKGLFDFGPVIIPDQQNSIIHLDYPVELIIMLQVEGRVAMQLLQALTTRLQIRERESDIFVIIIQNVQCVIRQMVIREMSL